MTDPYGIKSVYPESTVQVSYSDDSEPANPLLVVSVCVVAFAAGIALVFTLAWLATHLKIEPFAVAFIVALLAQRTFR